MSAGQQFWFAHKENMIDIIIDEFAKQKKDDRVKKNLIRSIGTLILVIG